MSQVRTPNQEKSRLPGVWAAQIVGGVRGASMSVSMLLLLLEAGDSLPAASTAVRW